MKNVDYAPPSVAQHMENFAKMELSRCLGIDLLAELAEVPY